MNKEETLKILMIRRAAYSISKSADDAQSEIEVLIWEKSFIDYTYDVVASALMHCIQTQKFQPTIAEIKTACVNIMHPELASNGLNAWNQFRKVISSSNSHEDYEKLPDIVKAITDYSDIKELGMCSMDYITTRVKPIFLKHYAEYIVAERDMLSNPAGLANAIETIRNEQAEIAMNGVKSISANE